MKKGAKTHWLFIFRHVLVFLLFVSLFTMLILYKESVSKSIYNSINYCLSALYPSLFPFMFASKFFYLSVPENLLTKIFSPFMKKLFKLRGNCFLAFIFALFFGYPLGAKFTSSMLNENKISENEAFRLFSCCLSPGIPFCVLFVGGKLLGNIYIGIVIFISIIISNILILFVSSFFSKTPAEINNVTPKLNIYEKVSFSLNSSAKALLNMALYVLIFRLLSDLLFVSGTSAKLNSILFFIPSEIKAFLSCFLFEVTGGTADAVNINLSLPYITAGLSFGGLSIFFQLFSFFKSHSFRLYKLIFIRAFCAFLSYFVCKILLFFIPYSDYYEIAVNQNLVNSVVFQNNFLSVAFLSLLFLSLVLLTEKA